MEVLNCATSNVAHSPNGTNTPFGFYLTVFMKSAKFYSMNKKAKRVYSYSVFYITASEGGYVAFVPALPGCHTQGETLEETEKNIREAIELYLESLAVNKESIPLTMCNIRCSTSA